MRGLTDAEYVELRLAACDVEEDDGPSPEEEDIAIRLAMRGLVHIFEDDEYFWVVETTALGRLALSLWPANRVTQ